MIDSLSSTGVQSRGDLTWLVRRGERVGAEAVGAGRPALEAQLDQQPQPAEEGDQADQQPPAGTVAVVAALDADHEAGPEQREAKEKVQQVAAEDQRDDDLQRPNGDPNHPEGLSVEPPSGERSICRNPNPCEPPLGEARVRPRNRRLQDACGSEAAF